MTATKPISGPPSQSLQDFAKDRIETKCTAAKSFGDRRIIWWDDGGYLGEVIREACSRRDELEFIGVDKHENPLVLRQRALESRAAGEGETAEGSYEVWYVPQKRGDRTWFRDVEEGDTSIEAGIEDLAAGLYRAKRWQVFDDTLEEAGKESRRAERAEYLLEQLAHDKTGRPDLATLQAELLTNGHGRPDEYILKMGWGDMKSDDDTARRVRKELEGTILGLEEGDGPDVITEKVRKWAVAQWMRQEGFPAGELPSPYDGSGSLENFRVRQMLQGILANAKRKESLDETYLGETHFFEGPIKQLDDVWQLVNCPVNGALDEQLWRTWLSDFEDEEFDRCFDRAVRRRDALCEAYDVELHGIGKDDSPWIRAWDEAVQMADLARMYETWDELSDTPVATLYGDEEEGTWRIDRAVRRIVVSGHPEKELPGTHPARDGLGRKREKLISTQYVEYMKKLGIRSAESLKNGEAFEGVTRSHGFLWEHRDKFETTERVAVFYIDALRLDLAYELADRLQKPREEPTDLTVESHLCAGMLPSETHFGMGAITPGRSDTFRVRLKESSGKTKLRAQRKGDELSTTQRETILEREGWSVTRDRSDGWEENRHVAYFDTEIDDIGEDDLSKIEEKLARRVEELAELIEEVMARDTWTKAFVVADHGFVLLPEEQTSFESESPSVDKAEIKRRRVASRGHDKTFSESAMVDSSTPGFDYLNDDVCVELLTHPLQRFKKQGITDLRFYHGGGLPQEFILNFLEITKE